MRDPDETPTLFGIDANRIVAFLGPHISWVAGAIATWLMKEVSIFASFGVNDNTLAAALSQAICFGVVTAIVWLGQHKWLDGFQKWAYQNIEEIREYMPDDTVEGPLTVEQSEAAAGFGEPGAGVVDG